jgi:hypothetical protein
MPVRIGLVVGSAARRYSVLVTTIELLGDALDAIGDLITDADDDRASSRWTIASVAELAQLYRKVTVHLNHFRQQAKGFEMELVTSEWKI